MQSMAGWKISQILDEPPAAGKRTTLLTLRRIQYLTHSVIFIDYGQTIEERSVYTILIHNQPINERYTFRPRRVFSGD